MTRWKRTIGALLNIATDSTIPSLSAAVSSIAPRASGAHVVGNPDPTSAATDRDRREARNRLVSYPDIASRRFRAGWWKKSGVELCAPHLLTDARKDRPSR
jgi:hypothetical protein